MQNLKSKIIFCSFKKVKWPQSCSWTLLLDIQCFRNTYRALKNDLAFEVVRSGHMHPSLFTVCFLSVVKRLVLKKLWRAKSFIRCFN